MKKETAEKIKKALKKEGATFETNFAYYDSKKEELRIKICGYNRAKDENEVAERTLTILRAMTKNGFRNSYKKERRSVSNNYGTFDCRYLIFK